MDRHSSSLPDRHANYLADVLETHGNRWEVGQEPDTGVWFESNGPPQPPCTLWSITLAGLAAKLNAEGTAS